MFDDMNKKEAANVNTSFGELINNPDRSLAEDGLYACIQLCHAAGVERSMIAESLFKEMIRALESRGKATDCQCRIWGALVARFRNELDELIEKQGLAPKCKTENGA